MTSLHEMLRAAKESGDWAVLSEIIPYAKFMGFHFAPEGGGMRAVMRYAPHLIGNFSLPALHGGAVGALLESAAIMQLLWQADSVRLPKTINITVDYLRPGKPLDTFARALVTRHGRRVANVRAEAWQDDPERPIATAMAHFLVMPDEPGAGTGGRGEGG